MTTTAERLHDILAVDNRNTYKEDVEIILREFVVIPRTELPEVEDRGGDRILIGKHTYPSHGDPQELRAEARRRLAVADYWEAEETTRAEAEAKRNTRRNELALEFTADTRGTLSGACNYAGLLPWTRKMVDRIIELEEAQTTP